MVTVFETMSPKSASGVIETLDDTVAVEALKRMEIKKMAKIMNIMDKNRSAKLSEMLTGHYSNSRNDLTKNPAGQSSGRDVALKEAPKPAAPAQPKAATPSATELGNSGAAGAENSTKGNDMND